MRFWPALNSTSVLQDIDIEALFEAEAAPGDASNEAPRYGLRVLDQLPALGPIRALVPGPPPSRLLGELQGGSGDAAAENGALQLCTPAYQHHSCKGGVFKADAQNVKLAFLQLHCCCAAWRRPPLKERPRLATADGNVMQCAEGVTVPDGGPQQAVAAVGSGRRGALALLRRSLVPQLQVVVPIPGPQRPVCCDMAVTLDLTPVVQVPNVCKQHSCAAQLPQLQHGRATCNSSIISFIWQLLQWLCFYFDERQLVHLPSCLQPHGATRWTDAVQHGAASTVCGHMVALAHAQACTGCGRCGPRGRGPTPTTPSC